MTTNVAIDPELLNHAQAVGGETTQRATVTRALEEYIARREQASIVNLFGTLERVTTFDHRRHRSRGTR